MLPALALLLVCVAPSDEPAPPEDRPMRPAVERPGIEQRPVLDWEERSLYRPRPYDSETLRECCEDLREALRIANRDIARLERRITLLEEEPLKAKPKSPFADGVRVLPKVLYDVGPDGRLRYYQGTIPRKTILVPFPAE
jgi:hypothetical protein